MQVYSESQVAGALAGAAIVYIIVGILALAAIVISIILSIRIYKKYIAKQSVTDYLRKCKSDSFLAPFVSFDKYTTPGVLQYCYALSAIMGFLSAIVLLIGGILISIIAGRILAVIGVLIAVILYIPISQVLIRLSYERQMVLFSMNDNIQKIANGQLATGQVQASKEKGVCPNCGHQNAETSTFCRKCGTKLEG